MQYVLSLSQEQIDLIKTALDDFHIAAWQKSKQWESRTRATHFKQDAEDSDILIEEIDAQVLAQ